MKRNILFAATAFTFAAFASVLAAGDGWLTDMEAAKAQAAKENKDLLLDFTGSDWCVWCAKLNDEVFSKEAFRAATKDKFVPVELDFPRKTPQDPQLKAQNKALAQQMKIQSYPTIMLCDAAGKPYAKTGYQPDGPEKYVVLLDKLQAIRVKRDQAFGDAAKAADDVEKAKCLIAGLNAMDKEIVEIGYGEVVEKIVQLDKEDRNGFVRARKEAATRKEAAVKTQAANQVFWNSKIQPLKEKKEFGKAVEEVKTYLKENPNLSVDIKAGMLLNTSMMDAMDRLDRDAVAAVVDEIAKAYPDSRIGKEADQVKESYKGRIDFISRQMKNAPHGNPQASPAQEGQK